MEIFVSIVAVVIAAGCFIAILMSDLKKGNPAPVPKLKPDQSKDA